MWFMPQGMAAKPAYCFKDKYKLDNLSKLYAWMGKKDWLTAIKADPNKLPKVLAKYKSTLVVASQEFPKRRAELRATLRKGFSRS